MTGGNSMSTFLDSQQISKSIMPEDKKRALQEAEMEALIKAKGFDPGRYSFRGDGKIMNRRDGSITSGKVTGSFIATDIPEDICFIKDDYNPETWHKICSIMGFKYHNHEEISKFSVTPKELKVSVEIITPDKEY